MRGLTSGTDRTPRRVRRFRPDDARVKARAISRWCFHQALSAAEGEEALEGIEWLQTKVWRQEAEERALAEIRLARLAEEIRTRQKALGQMDWVGHGR